MIVCTCEKWESFFTLKVVNELDFMLVVGRCCESLSGTVNWWSLSKKADFNWSWIVVGVGFGACSLFHLYNVIDHPYGRFLIFKRVIKLAVAGKVTDLIVPSFKRMDAFLQEWNITETDKRDIFLSATNILKDHKGYGLVCCTTITGLCPIVWECLHLWAIGSAAFHACRIWVALNFPHSRSWALNWGREAQFQAGNPFITSVV